MKSNGRFVALVIGLLVVAGIVVTGLGRGWFGDGQIEPQGIVGKQPRAEPDAPTSSVKRDVQRRKLSEALGVSEGEITKIGGIDRPIRDVATRTAGSSAPSPKNPLPNAGQLPALKGDENPQVAAYRKEVHDLNGPKEARSAMFLPQDFDKERYFENPEEYLGKIRPGRVFQPAKPGPDVPQVAAASDRLVTILQNERAILKVKAKPQHPVTFYTPDGGEFSNRLKSISVAANDDGIAETSYTAVSGTQGIINVLAASPLHSGQVRFAVKVVLPDQ